MKRLTCAPFLLIVLAACNGSDGKFGTYNTAPTVTISGPPDGSVYDEGMPVDFVARVSDDQTPETDLYLVWSAQPGGEISATTVPDDSGNVVLTTASLPPGNIVITLSATDSLAETGSDDITVTINDLADNPEIGVLHPATGERGTEGEEFRFVVQVSDAQQSPDELLIEFTSDIDGTFCAPRADASGYAECSFALSGGKHRLVFSVADADSLRAEETVYFSVLGASDIDNDGDGWTESNGDCDDGDASVNPNADEYNNGRDDDCDDEIDEGTEGGDDDGDGYSEDDGDCNDAYNGSYPGATEVCDGLDNDCDTVVDEDTTCYDDDGDGYRELDGDCDDGWAATFPRAPEVEDGRDNDCDGIIDEGTAAYDDDGDGYSENAGDCNDANASIGPRTTETCDGLDNDCDSSVDELGASGCTNYYYDGDRDGYGAGSAACMCAPSGGYDSTSSTDCYDGNAAANPASGDWYTTARGDASYDYNCDGRETHYYTNYGSSCYWDTFGCSTDATGWQTSDPGCGGSGTYITGCYCDSEFLGVCISCAVTTSRYAQYCR